MMHVDSFSTMLVCFRKMILVSTKNQEYSVKIDVPGIGTKRVRTDQFGTGIRRVVIGCDTSKPHPDFYHGCSTATCTYFSLFNFPHPSLELKLK